LFLSGSFFEAVINGETCGIRNLERKSGIKKRHGMTSWNAEPDDSLTETESRPDAEKSSG
jgi:hypothetical protein